MQIAGNNIGAIVRFDSNAVNYRWIFAVCNAMMNGANLR